MPRISVTLDVSRSSGWLNANAPCRVETRTYEVHGARCRQGEGRGAWDGGGSSGLQGIARLRIGRMARVGAHKTCRACL